MNKKEEKELDKAIAKIVNSTPEEINRACKLIMESKALKEKQKVLTINQTNIMNYIKNSSWKNEFVITDLMRGLGESQPYWEYKLAQLVDLGYLIIYERGTYNVYGII